MAYGRRPRKAKGQTKKTYRRYRPKRSNASTMVSKMAPIPDRYLTKLRYSEGNSITYTALSEYASYQYRLNSIYDPNLTGVGHQPLGHDELANLYNRYRVLGVAYKVVITNRDSNYEGEIAIQLRPNSTLSTKFSDVAESNYSQVRTIRTAPAGGVQTLKGYISIARIRGVKKSVARNDDTYQALFGANPTREPVLNIYLRNQNVNFNMDFAWRVYLTYYVVCSDTKVLQQS